MYEWLRPILFRMNPERAHLLTIQILQRVPSLTKLMGKAKTVPENVSQTLWNLDFPHPIGLAAGLDKNGEAVDAFLTMGFAFVEVGTVTPKPQPGNPSPRLFRLVEDDALINRMGFNNNGADALATLLAQRKAPGLVAVNIGKNKVTPNDDAISDYVYSTRAFAELADFFVINVSSPNTPGLRDLQAVDTLVPLVEAVVRERDQTLTAQNKAKPPVLVKLAPDLADESIIEIARGLQAIHIDGFIATNTTLARNGLHSRHQNESGGLSGRPLKARSTEVVSLVYGACEGRTPIIASGGVFTAADAYEKVRAGASLVELYTALIYQGPQVIQEIVGGLSALLMRDGFESITAAVGADHRDM